MERQINLFTLNVGISKLTKLMHPFIIVSDYIFNLRNSLWGYDFFISYHWASGAAYAVHLAARLREKNYDVYLDRAENVAGDDWRKVGNIALRNTQRLVLIATREAVFESKAVKHEIVQFTERNNHCIPIFFGEKFVSERQLGGSSVLSRLSDDMLYLEDTNENLLVGSPSEEVIDKLAAAHGITRRRTIRNRLVAAVIALLTLAVIAVTGFAWRTELARIQEKEANETVETQLAEISLQNGHQAIQANGDIAPALLWYANALQAKGRKAESARESARALIGAWSIYLPRPLPLSNTKATAASFDPEGLILAVADEEGTVELWEVQSGKPLGNPLKHEHRLNSMSFSADGKTLRTDDGTVRFWNIQNGQSHPKPISGGVLSPDGHLSATNTDRSVKIWDVETGEFKGKLLPFGMTGPLLAFSPDVSLLAVGVADIYGGNYASILNLKTTEQEYLITHGKAMIEVAFSHDGQKLLTAGDVTRLWNPLTGEALGKPIRHTGRLESVRFSFDSKFLATAGSGTVWIWNAEAGERLTKAITYHGNIGAMSFGRADNTIYTVTFGDTVRIWKEAKVVPLRNFTTHNGFVGAIAYSDDGRKLIIASEHNAGDGAVARLDAQTGATSSVSYKFAGFTEAVSFSRDGAKLALATDLVSDGKEISLRDTVTGEPRGKTLRRDRFAQRVEALSLNSDGYTIGIVEVFHYTKPPFSKVTLWDARKGSIQGDPFKVSGIVHAISFTPDGRTIALSLTQDKAFNKLIFLDIESGIQRSEEVQLDREATSVLFSPSGKVFATGGKWGAQLWDTRSKAVLGIPFEVDGGADGLAFNSEGNELATANYDAVHYWAVSRSLVASPERVWTSMRLRTGLTIDNGTIRPLTRAEFKDLYEKENLKMEQQRTRR